MTTGTLTTTPVARATLGTTFLAMLAREMRVMRRNFVATFLRVVLQPLLFVFVFSYVLPKTGAPSLAGGSAGPRFGTILVPGLVGSAIIMQGIMAVVFPLVMELSWQRSIQDRALAPLPIPLLALEKIVAAGLQAVIGGLLVFPAVLLVHAKGEAPSVHIDNWLLFVVVMIAGAVVAAAAGLFLGTVIDPRQIQVMFALVLLPMTMLGCVYYPWASLQHIRWLQIAVLANPMVYVSEGLRAALTPQLEHMSTVAFLSVLLIGAAGLCLLAMRTFTRRVLT
jgi:ABC-2 type transport system permease protein